MQDISENMAGDQKRTYMGHLAKIEEWLLKASQGLDNSSEMSKTVGEIEESFSYAVKNFDQVIESNIALDKRITVVVSTLNTLLRVYTIDKSTVIISQESLQSIIDVFTNSLVNICSEILPNDKDDAKDLSDSLSTKSADEIRYNKYAANIFDLLLTNFAQDALLKRCLDLFFSNETPSQKGKIIYDFQHELFCPLSTIVEQTYVSMVIR